jgi:hypothetical protein
MLRLSENMVTFTGTYPKAEISEGDVTRPGVQVVELKNEMPILRCA